MWRKCARKDEKRIAEEEEEAKQTNEKIEAACAKNWPGLLFGRDTLRFFVDLQRERQGISISFLESFIKAIPPKKWKAKNVLIPFMKVRQLRLSLISFGLPFVEVWEGKRIHYFLAGVQKSKHAFVGKET